VEDSNKDNSLVKAMKKIDFLIFFLLAIGITWTGWYMVDSVIMPLVNEDANFEKLIFEEGQYFLILASLLGTISVFGPAMSAFIVIRITEGKRGTNSLLRKILNWRVTVIWYAVALIIPIIVKYSCFIINDLFLGGTLSFDIELLLSFSFVFVFFEQLIPSGGQEEIGWVGFVQLQLQERYGVIQATLIKILMGWVWHLPLYLVFPWVSQYGQDIWLFLWYYIPIGFIYTWLFNNTDSILIPALLHASFNTVGIHALTGYTSNENVVLTVIIMGLLMYIFVGFLFLKYGKNLARKSLPAIQQRITT
jgi:membrane protease YdiL (CAAX protease family)